MNDPLLDSRQVNLKLVFFLPLTVTIAIIACIYVYLVYQDARNHVDSQIQRTRNDATTLLSEYRNVDANELEVLCHSLIDDNELKRALEAHDRSKLLSLATPLFLKISAGHGITHLYFIGPDRHVILRVHQPSRYGDLIKRRSLLMAEATGDKGSALEVGPMGLLTLRHVEAWHDAQGKLIGYVEAGMEIDTILNAIEKHFGSRTYLMLNKSLLNREKWQQTMMRLKRRAQWDEFDHEVLVNIGKDETVPEPIVEVLKKHRRGQHHSHAFRLNGHDFTLTAIHLGDKSDKQTSDLWVQVDTSMEVERADNIIRTAVTSSLLLGCILLLFFYQLISRLETRINSYQQQLHELATHDGLTGAFNRKSFDHHLAEEIRRTERHHRPLSLLMIDLDHFKKINDEYGHPAGDRILQEIARNLTQHMRSIDFLARYGGEEFAFILPETRSDEAVEIAERLRQMSEESMHVISSQHTIQVTLSIGVAAYGESTDTAEAFVKKADEALYQAKNDGRNCVRRA